MKKLLETHNIFIDTQVFGASNFDYSSQLFKTLISLIHDKRISVHLTEITFNEIKSNIREEVEKARSKFQSLQAKSDTRIIKNITGPLNNALNAKFDVEEVFTELADQLGQFLLNIDAHMIPIEGVSILEVFERYFSRKPPFGKDKKKNEFPDAFVLAALQKWCQENQEKVYVISGDADMIYACAGSEYLISVPTLEGFLDLVAAENELYEFANQLLEKYKDAIIAEIYTNFPDIGFWLDEVDGEVYDVNVQSVKILKKYLVRLEEYKAIFELRAKVVYSAEISYADLVVEGESISETEETIERDLKISVEASLLFDVEDESAFQIEYVNIKDGDIILYPGPTYEQLK
jgi:hypothetical protein